MAHIRVTIEGSRGVGKTTFAKYLFNLLANGTYFVESVSDSTTIDAIYVQSLAKPLVPRRREPRSIEITILEQGFSEDLIEDEADE